VDFVKIFPALLTKVFFGRTLGTEDADTSSMLPYFANIALHKKPSNVFCEFDRSEEVGVGTVDGRAAGVVLAATYAPNCLVLLVLQRV
jgi:hypothetical protein